MKTLVFKDSKSKATRMRYNQTNKLQNHSQKQNHDNSNVC